MKKFKDFLYDKNDILIAVLILVVAAAIIAWRMDVILQYPKQLIHNDNQSTRPRPTIRPSGITAATQIRVAIIRPEIRVTIQETAATRIPETTAEMLQTAAQVRKAPQSFGLQAH